jgi:hypothetical protein
MAQDAPPLEIKEFTGGPNDDYLSGLPNEYQKAENVLLNREGKPYSRPGSVLLDLANPQLPSGSHRVNKLVNYAKDQALLAISGAKAYSWANPGWTEISSPAGSSLMTGTENGNISTSEYKKQVFVASDEHLTPVKIYKDSGGTFRSVSAGLPTPANNANFVEATETANAIALANDIRTKLLAHFADVAIHTAADTVSQALITSSAATDLATLLTLTGQLLIAYDSHYRDSAPILAGATSASVTKYHAPYISTITSDEINPKIFPYSPALTTKNAPTTLQEAASRLNDLRKNLNFHDGDVDVHTSGGSVGAHLVTASRMQSLTYGPSIVPDYQPLYDLANQIKQQYLAHRASGMTSYTGITRTNGSPTLTGFGSTAAVNVGYYVFGTGLSSPAKVISKTGTTVTLDTNLSSSGTGTFGIGSGSEAHAYPDINASTNVTSPNATSLDSLRTLLLDLRIAYASHANQNYASVEHFQNTFPSNEDLADAVYLAGAHVTTPILLPDFFSGFNSDMISGMIAALNELKTKFDAHDADVTLHYADPLITSKQAFQVRGPSLSLSSYNWAFIYSHTYTTIDGITFKTVSAPILKAVSDASLTNTPDADQGKILSIGQAYPTITGIPALANSGSTNYDVSNIKVEIYRTTENGSTYYKTGEVNNGVTTFTDRTMDSDLAQQEELYTTGGVVDSDPAPPSKFVHVTGSKGLWANTIENGIAYPQRIRESLEGAIDSCPGSAFIDLPNECVGVCSNNGVRIAWTKTATYRIEGTFDLLGRGSMSYIEISNSVGLSGPYSPVQTDKGVVFAGTDGWYVTDGYKVSPISKKWLSSYLNLVSTSTKAARLQGTLDYNTNRVWWGATVSGIDNDAAYILDMNHGLKDNAVFTTVKNGTSFVPTSLVFFNGQIIRGDSRGYVFKHDAQYLTDPKVDTLVTPSNWVGKTIIYDLITSAFDWGTVKYRKWVNLIVAKFKNHGNLSCQINGINDDGAFTGSCAPIRSRGATGLIKEKRRFPAGGIRCFNKQIQFTNAKVVLNNSDTLGLCTVNKAAKTATISAGIWPSDLADQVITFENDGYVQEFAISSQTSTVLTLSDPGSLLPASGSYKWELKGYPKDEQFELDSFALDALIMSPTAQTAEGETGANE